MTRLYKVGDKVRIERICKDGLGTSTIDEMSPHVGKLTNVCRFYGVGSTPYLYRLDIEPSLIWREDELSAGMFNPDQKCIQCNTLAPHADCKASEYICDFCAASKNLDVEEEDCCY